MPAPNRPAPTPHGKPVVPPRPTHTINVASYQSELERRLAIDIANFNKAGEPVPQAVTDMFLNGAKAIMAEQAQPLKP